MLSGSIFFLANFASFSGSLSFQFKGSASTLGSFSITGDGTGLKALGLDGFSSSISSSIGSGTARASFFLAASLA